MWSTQTTEYRSWLHSDRPCVLWVTGGAGTGKTTLANYLVQRLRDEDQRRRDRSTKHFICSFFCSQDVEGQHDVKSLLQDLVLQLAESDHKTLRHIKAAYGISKRDHSWSFEGIWKMFETVLALVPYSCIYVTIDALDECDGDLNPRLFRKLAQVQAMVLAGSLRKLKQLKLIISGQPQVRASWSMARAPVDHFHIGIQDHLIMHDIHLFVHVKVAELVDSGICSRLKGELLKKRLTSMAENSFLWLNVALKHIKSSLRYHHDDIGELLSELPDNLEKAFTRYLPQVDRRDVHLLQCFLKLLTASSRPLKLKEIDVLINVSLGRPSLLAADEDTVIEDSIQKALGPLVIFPNHSTVQFIHSKAKEFFISLSNQPLHELHKSHGIRPDQAHLFCARSCMAYLVHESVSYDSWDSQRLDSPSTDTESPASITTWQDGDDGDMMAGLFNLKEAQFLRSEESLAKEVCLDIQDRFAAYDYAATNWAYHLVHSQSLLLDTDVSRALDLLPLTTGPQSGWYKYLAHTTSVEMPRISESTPIVIAAMFNLTKIMLVLLDASSDRLPSRESLFTALYWASARGSLDAVEMLIQHGAPISGEHDRRSPLAVATDGDHIEICRLILAADDIDPNRVGADGKPALVIAAEANHEQILHLLLSHPAIQVDQPDSGGRTALMIACQQSRVDCVGMLRRDGRADVRKTDRKGQSSIHYVGKAGDMATLKELMQFPHIDLAATDSTGRNAISIASQEGHLLVVKHLYRKGVDVAGIDTSGRNAISWAASSMKSTFPVQDGTENTLQYLLRKVPHAADTPDHYGWSPLTWAMDPPGYFTSVEILSQSAQVDINRRDLTSGRSILAWAVCSSLTDVVQCLLRNPRLDLNAVCSAGQTALSYAAERGMIDCVQLLLQRTDIAVHLADNKARTPLDWAALNQHWEIWNLLRAVPVPVSME